MESLVIAMPRQRSKPKSPALAGFGDAFVGRTVLVTGHTGFKGSWLVEWLLALGARVVGFSLPPPTDPSLFALTGLESRLEHHLGDVRDPVAVAGIVHATQPDFVFHLAAQPLVRESYRDPVATYATNVMGTIHLLEAARQLPKPAVVLCVTTDKCYENKEWVFGYREEDPLGGYDPYSSSKAAAEIAIAAWRRSFFGGHPVRVASARAGNVIGGGDYALDRIVPDCVRALEQGNPIAVRNPVATRPWQHVLEPLSGYLWLAAVLARPELRPHSADGLASAFNFGPTHESNRTVRELVTEVLRHWPGQWVDQSDPQAVHEARLLQLSIDRASALLGWQPVWSFPEAVAQTIGWYRQARRLRSATGVRQLTADQIRAYAGAARQAGLPWAV